MTVGPRDAESRSLWKRRALWALKLAFTVLLLTLAFRKVPLHELRAAWGRIHTAWALGAVAVYVPLCVLAESARLWAAGKRVAAPALSLREWMVAFLASRPWFYLLPASAGADGMIWYRLRRRGWSHGGCGYAVLAVRFWGLAVWAIVAGCALRLAPQTRGILMGAPAWTASPWLWLAGGFLALAGCIAAPHWLARKEHVDLNPAAPMEPLADFGLTLLSAAVTAGCVWMAAKAGSLPFGLWSCFGLLAWLNFAMALPLSLGGLGLQEALVLRLGLPLGLGPAPLLAFSGIVHLMRAAMALAGGLTALGSEARSLNGAPSP
jgi:uncharacterized membrane protein YbhN (UPF0104 family)